ncbi:MAG TPA: phosphatidylcholine/phosphatidylserine synthase [Terriglobales bacterium]|nr:phosphatidylcholine/phosphatidylserine synthase [Terriglobales bacterium]
MSDEQLQLPVEPQFRRRRLRKRIYLLPSLFTIGNILLGYIAISQTLQGTATEFWHFDNAAKAIGWAILLDMLDGRLARLTQTTSDFGRELDSLADVISFGVAPALLAWIWGFRMLPAGSYADLHFNLVRLGFVASFVFLITGAARLARFNIQVDPQPSNPGRPGKRYFVGMPIPAGAGVIAAVVHFAKGDPLFTWWLALIWLLLMLAAGFLMVSTWRFYSFKDIDLRSRHPFTVIVLVGVLIAAIALFSRYALFAIALTYMLSGVLVRLFYILRPRRSTHPTPPESYTEASEAR